MGTLGSKSQQHKSDNIVNNLEKIITALGREKTLNNFAKADGTFRLTFHKPFANRPLHIIIDYFRTISPITFRYM